MIPEGWLAYKLSDLVDLIGGGTPKTSVPEYWNGNIPWLSVVDFGKNTKHVFNTEKTITEKGLIESSTKVLKKGYLVISARGTVGELAMLGEDMAFNQSCYGINSKDKTINDYIYYLIKHNVNQIKRKTHGAVFETITRLTFENIDVQIPQDLREQTRIAAILSSLDDKIELNLQMNKTLETIAQAIFKEWFVDFRFPGFDGDLINGSPKRWRMGKVVDLFQLQRGYDLPSTSRVEGKYPVVAASGISSYHNEFKVSGPGVTTGRSGIIGNVYYLKEDFWPLNTSLFIKEYYQSTPLYAYFVLKNLALRNLNGGSAVPTLNRNDVHRLDHCIPSMEIIMQFEAIVSSFFNKIYLNESENKLLIRIRDALIPKLISGKIRVP